MSTHKGEMMSAYDLTTLPDGRVLVTRREQREGFTVPEAVLVGVFDTMEQAKEFVQEPK